MLKMMASVLSQYGCLKSSDSSLQFRFRSYLLDWWWFNPQSWGSKATLYLSAVEEPKDIIFCRF